MKCDDCVHCPPSDREGVIFCEVTKEWKAPVETCDKFSSLEI